MKDAQTSKEKNMKTMLILLIVVSAALLTGLSALLPVTISVGKNREEIVLMFTEIPLQKIKEEAAKCRQYCTQLHCGEDQATILLQNKELDKEGLAQENPTNLIEDQEEKPLKPQEEESNEPSHFRQKESAHTRKYVQFRNPIIKTIIWLLLLMLLLESYFLFGYFQSFSILSHIMDLTREQSGTYSLKFYNSFALRAVQETIANHNAEVIIMNKGSDFIINYIDNLINEQEDYYKQHVANKGIHQQEYNDLYHDIVYKDICAYVTGEDVVNCTTELYGLPNKGLHQSNVAFWELLRQVLVDFEKSMNAVGSLNDARLLESEILLERYLYKAYDILAHKLEDEVKEICDKENKLMLVIFVVYLLVVAGIFALWQVFIARMNNRLNSTRTILGIIPPEIIRDNKKIRDYMINTSKLLFSSSTN